jgi:hypothetical protein
VALGPSAANANTLVDGMTGAGGGGFVKFHTGDPGSAGTSNAAGDTTRPAITFPAASAGSATQTGTATLASWAGGSQTVSHFSLWSASSGGTFRGSGAFSASRAVVNGDTLNVSGIVASCTAAA